MTDAVILGKQYIRRAFRPGSKDWNDYELAKWFIEQLDINTKEYDHLIKFITDYLEL